MVRPINEYPHRQTSEKVTIAAQVSETDAETQDAFGKVNPYRFGILPVLIVIQNDSVDAIKVDAAQFVYVLPDRTRVEATPAADVKYIHGASSPKTIAKPLGGSAIRKAPKNPLAEWEIEGRSFAAKMIPAGQSASGFVYFQTQITSAAASIYISGLTDPVTRKELFYFEIPLSGN
ncbi:MAG TPA: hypothetical protein VG273_13095 [Bryobacteraceae bacterium]|jgi:hypothetical protein|nr:hypothetical protein [Bryobacteraceae bacterium]